MSLLALWLFLDTNFVVLDDSWGSYLGPATKSFKGADGSFQSKHDGEGVGIIAAKRS